MEEVPVPAVQVDLEVWFEATKRDVQNRKRHFLAVDQPNPEEFCTPEILSMLNNSFSAGEIEEILSAGFLRGMRVENIPLQKYSNIKKAAEKFEQELRSNVIRSIETTLRQAQQTLAERREDVIALVSAAVLAGLDINAKGQNGRTLIHEMLSLEDRSEVLSGDRTVYEFFYNSEDFKVDWEIKDERGLTLVEYAVDKKKDKFASYLVMKGYISVSESQVSEKLREDREGSDLDRKLEDVRKAPRSFAFFSRYYYISQITSAFSSSLSNAFAEIRSPSRLRIGLDNLLSTLNDYCFEFEIRNVLEIEKESSINVSVHPSLGGENIDLVGKYPHVVNVVYARARKALSSNFSQGAVDVEHVTYALKLAQNQIEIKSNSGSNRFVRFFANFKHKRMRAAVLDYIQKHLWSNQYAEIPPVLFRLLFNEFSLDDIEKVLMGTNWRGKTLLSYIKDKGIVGGWRSMLHLVSSPEVAEWLIKKGVDVNAPGYEGMTPLHKACMDGNYELARCFVRNGADVLAVTNEGKTPLECIEWQVMEDKYSQPKRYGQRWKQFLETKMGLALDHLDLLRNLELAPRDFLALPALLREKILTSVKFISWFERFVLKSGLDISFKKLCELDLTPDKKGIVNFINKFNKRHWDDSQVLEEMRAEVDAIVKGHHATHASEIALYRNKKETLFSKLPRDVSIMIAVWAKPDLLTVEDALAISRKIIARKEQVVETKEEQTSAVDAIVARSRRHSANDVRRGASPAEKENVSAEKKPDSQIIPTRNRSNTR